MKAVIDIPNWLYHVIQEHREPIYSQSLGEHESDRTFTGHIIVSDLCRDTANLLEELEQEPVLDKIRTEIEAKIVKRPWLDFEDRERDRNDAFLEVLDIIDKYKAESEEE